MCRNEDDRTMCLTEHAPLGFTELFHAYVYPHAPCAMRFWFDVADSDHDGRMRPDDIERMLQVSVFL